MKKLAATVRERLRALPCRISCKSAPDFNCSATRNPNSTPQREPFSGQAVTHFGPRPARLPAESISSTRNVAGLGSRKWKRAAAGTVSDRAKTVNTARVPRQVKKHMSFIWRKILASRGQVATNNSAFRPAVAESGAVPSHKKIQNRMASGGDTAGDRAGDVALGPFHRARQIAPQRQPGGDRRRISAACPVRADRPDERCL